MIDRQAGLWAVVLAVLGVGLLSSCVSSEPPESLLVEPDSRTANGFPPSARELNGVWLGEPLAEIEARLGQPYNVMDGQTGGQHRTYTLDASTGSYMVITFWPFRPGNAFAVQVNSDDALPIPTLHGLTLGASREDLIAAVGAPSSERPVADLARTLLLYDGRNYSFEVDSSLRLVSARISGYTGVLSGEGWPQNWEAYRPYSIGQAVAQIPTDGDVNLVPPGALGFQALVQNTKTLRIILSETERHILELSLRSASFEADVLASGLESTVAVLVTEGG
ncbi:MAG: hypothetical protein ABGY42_10815, partial [bacterium]